MLYQTVYIIVWCTVLQFDRADAHQESHLILITSGMAFHLARLGLHFSTRPTCVSDTVIVGTHKNNVLRLPFLL